MDSLKGQLLIATAGLLDPNFHRTVVLVTEHSEEGAMGLVLNRPAELAAAEAAPQLESLVGPEEPVFVGGPVESQAGVVLAGLGQPHEAAAAGLRGNRFTAGETDGGTP